MAKNNAQVQNNNEEVKNTQNMESSNEIKEQDQAPATAPENVPASTEATPEPEKEGLGKRIWNKVKKPLAIVGGVAAGAAALFVATKVGEAKGFDKAYDAFTSGDDPDTGEGGDDGDTGTGSDDVEVTEF